MFLEPNIHPRSGWIEVICGSMFSGKTEELIRRLRRAIIAGQRVEIFKPAIDKRYDEDAIVSHNLNRIPSTAVGSAMEILLLSEGVDVIGIDEAQFFDNTLVEVANELANRGSRVIIAGLDMDYLGRPFGPMPYLLAIAEFVTKLHAICVRTGTMAHYSHRKIAHEGQTLLGTTDIYEPLSRYAFVQEMQKRKK